MAVASKGRQWQMSGQHEERLSRITLEQCLDQLLPGNEELGVLIYSHHCVPLLMCNKGVGGREPVIRVDRHCINFRVVGGVCVACHSVVCTITLHFCPLLSSIDQGIVGCFL